MSINVKKVIILIFCYLSVFEKMNSYGSLELLFENAIGRDFESLESGIDSSVMKLQGLESFNSEVIRSKKPVVVKFFHERSLSSEQSKQLYQELAENFQGKVQFFSVDLSENRELVMHLAAFIFKLIAGQSNLANSNPASQGELMIFSQNITRLEGDVVPLLLFFKNASLILPRRCKLLKKEELLSDIKLQLLGDLRERPKDELFTETLIFDNERKSMPVKEKGGDFWNRTKRWLSKFFD